MTGNGEVQEWMKVYVEQVRAGDDACTDWPFSTFTKSGRACAYNSRRHQVEMAGRTTWEIFHGRPFPDGLQARHSCGNGHLACANPLHIIPGTSAENAADAMAHGTYLRGEAHSRTIATNEQIISACSRLATSEPLRQIATDLGISTYTISRAWTGHTWTHLDMPRKADVDRLCKECGAAISRSAPTKRIFCSEQCSWTWRNAARRQEGGD